MTDPTPFQRRVARELADKLPLYATPSADIWLLYKAIIEAMQAQVEEDRRLRNRQIVWAKPNPRLND